jgi:hypothetical protein
MPSSHLPNHSPPLGVSPSPEKSQRLGKEAPADIAFKLEKILLANLNKAGYVAIDFKFAEIEVVRPCVS